MRLLVFAKRFSMDGTSKWLVDELVDEFVERGWQVQVILFDLSGVWPHGQLRLSERVSVYALPVLDKTPKGLLKKYFLFFSQWIRALMDVRKQDFGHFDLLINFSIASIFLGLARHVNRVNPGISSLLILWDFFPVHQWEIGKIKSRLFCRLLYRIEAREISAYQNVGLMSERNIDYFRD